MGSNQFIGPILDHDSYPVTSFMDKKSYLYAIEGVNGRLAADIASETILLVNDHHGPSSIECWNALESGFCFTLSLIYDLICS